MSDIELANFVKSVAFQLWKSDSLETAEQIFDELFKFGKAILRRETAINKRDHWFDAPTAQ